MLRYYMTPLPLMAPSSSLNDNAMIRLAREIAMDMRPIAEILKAHEIGQADFEEMLASSVFQGYLRRFIEEWQSATNTRERVVLKSLAFVEESLPEFFARAHDPRESLNFKVEVLKTVAKLAELGNGRTSGAGADGSRFSVTINLGDDRQLKIEHELPNYDIEGDRL